MTELVSEKIAVLESELHVHLERIEEMISEIESLGDWVDGPQPNAEHPDFDRSTLFAKANKDTFDSLSGAAFEASFLPDCLENVIHNLEDAVDSWSDFEKNTA